MSVHKQTPALTRARADCGGGGVPPTSAARFYGETFTLHGLTHRCSVNLVASVHEAFSKLFVWHLLSGRCIAQCVACRPMVAGAQQTVRLRFAAIGPSVMRRRRGGRSAFGPCWCGCMFRVWRGSPAKSFSKPFMMSSVFGCACCRHMSLLMVRRVGRDMVARMASHGEQAHTRGRGRARGCACTVVCAAWMYEETDRNLANPTVVSPSRRSRRP